MPRALTQIQRDVVETRLRLNVAHKDIAEEIDWMWSSTDQENELQSQKL